MPRQKLLTKETMRKLPALYAQEDKGGDAVVYLKFFTPDSSWTWYATEGNAVVQEQVNGEYCTVTMPLRQWLQRKDGVLRDVEFFGLVDGQCKELGYFTLRELREARGPLGLAIERDAWWRPQTLREVWPDGPWKENN